MTTVFKSIDALLSLLFVITFSVWPSTLSAQRVEDVIQGQVTAHDEAEQTYPLYGASVFWLNSHTGTTTDVYGHFELKRIEGYDQIVVSYIGYTSDTLKITDNGPVTVVLSDMEMLDGIEIVYRQKSTEIDFLESKKVENISGKELLKAACCNLSESFETSPSVDVSFTDAVTGTRQIQMLGLASPNTQITRENMPDVRGLSAIYGLTYIPGTWIEGIQVVKGAGSVVNGYESIAGQINVNLQRPERMDKLLLNAYVNEGGRLEGNANLRIDAGNDWGSALLLHGSYNGLKHDRNKDGFLDMPLSKQFVGLNRWELRTDNGIHFEAGIKGTHIDKIGGELDFNRETDEGTSNAWGMHLLMRRAEGWTKLGKVNTQKPWQSVGLQLSGATHHQHSNFGLTNYEGTQNTFYSNLLFQSIIANTNHKMLTGLSLQYDDYQENFYSEVYDRTEVVPGAFVEYTFNHLDKFTTVAGLRFDHHNLYGGFVTPRLHMRYAFNDHAVLRWSGGRGQRTANILAENSGLMASARQFVIEGNDPDLPYGLNPEVAWNFGLNFTHDFTIDYRDGFFSIDFYRTDFQNQIVVDLDRNTRQASFYNLSGKSISNSFQAQVDYEIVKRVDLRMAYRLFDVRTTYSDLLRQKPLISKHRFFVNMAYESRKYWKLDYTLNWQGPKRIPDTYSNPEPYRLEEKSPGFVVMNAQVSKTWKEKLEVYLGVENLLNYTQNDPIVASEDPFGPYFDSSMIWGPIFGRNLYTGLRYTFR